MPELPEVETIVRGLRERVLLRTFFDVWSDYSGIIKKPEKFRQFKEEIKKRKIQKFIGEEKMFSLRSNY